MIYANTGFYLDVDLHSGRVERVEFPPELYEQFLGGKGANVKIFWDHTKTGGVWSDPENLLVFGAGLLTGTSAPAANRVTVTTRSPITNSLTYSSLGGFWGPELKCAGYDGIIVRGKSAVPVCLFIRDGKAELRAAASLWGMDTTETESAIRKAMRSGDAQVVCIGPAGENEVSFASIEHSIGASASRSGIGAVMGNKKLKAIAVLGHGDINIARGQRFFEIGDQIFRKSKQLSDFVDNYSRTRIKGHLEKMRYGNMGENIPWPNSAEDHADFLAGHRTSRPTCHNCWVRCRSTIHLGKGGSCHVKCFSWLLFAGAFKIRDFAFNLKCYDLCRRYGMDTVSTSSMAALAIDLYEKGILGSRDTDGLRLQAGSEEVAFWLIERIARRQGIGSILADGAYSAAGRIGKGAEKHAYHVKRLEILPYALYVPYLAYTSALSDRSDLIKALGEVLQHRLPTSKEEKAAYIQSGFYPYPREFEKYLFEPPDPSGADYERQADIISYDTDKITISDCAGICIFWTGHWPYAPVKLEDMADLISAATGKTFSEEDLRRVARRTRDMIRSYDLMAGLGKADDSVPHQFFEKKAGVPMPPLDRGRFTAMVEEFYKIRGWDQEGVPTPETLRDLGLDYVARKLEEKGIYNAGRQEEGPESHQDRSG